jgi:PadR family transcriptional regulator PadR
LWANLPFPDWGRVSSISCAIEDRIPAFDLFPTGITRFFLLDLFDNFFYIAKQMKRGELLGSLEHIILLALAGLDESAHGMIVRREIEERIGRNLSIGAVYATLERLEAKGYVSSFTGEPTPERGGRAKRLFRVEAAGKRALVVSDQTLRRTTAGLNRWERI